MRSFYLSLCLAILSAVPAGLEAATPDPADVIWLEVEQFAECGGWANDPQFVSQMGSPYLLANGVGKPVEDAVTRAAIPQAGEYRLWVRCKDWHPEHSPGQFKVLVGGKEAGGVFGKSGEEGWRWIDGGSVNLEAGRVQVRLHDLTGWWGRCDAIVLTRDRSFRPSDDLVKLAEQRERYGGVSREIKQPGPYDVVVVGGGLAGTAAAISAARQGVDVALIQDRPILGGNGSNEIGVPPEGDTSRQPLDPKETGVIEDFWPPEGKTGDWSTRMETVVRAEPKIDLFLNTRATGVDMKNKKEIEAVLALNVHTGERYRFGGRIFVDCTGDGWVGFWAGADYRQGQDAREDFDEDLAPVKAGMRTMGNTLYNMAFKDHDQPVEFKAPPWAFKWTSPDDFGNDPIGAVHTNGDRPASFDVYKKTSGREPRQALAGYRQWWVEFGGMDNTIESAEWIRDELFRINIGLWDYVKNYSPKFKDENRNRELVWLNYVPGTRESRRLIGDYILTQKDYAERIVHEDSAAYAGWGLDVHHPWGFFAPGNLYMSSFRQKTSIPYRCMYSRNIDNLMMAGRDISVSHIALGATRVMRTCCIIGQAAGTAASIAVREYTTPRGVYRKHLDDLQDTLLKDGAYIMGRPNRDPDDLARKATVRASSEGVIVDPRRPTQTRVNGGLIHDMHVNRMVMFTATEDHVERVALFLRSTLAEPKVIEATLRPAAKFGDFGTKDFVAKATALVRPNSAGWVEFPLQAKLKRGQPYFVELPAAAGLKWDLYPTEPKGTTRAYGRPNWKQMYGCYKFRLTPGGEPAGADEKKPDEGSVTLAAENVIDGWNRAVDGAPNSWGPDPSKPLPQWVELKLRKQLEFCTVHVSFQLREMAARAYRIEVSSGGVDWKTVASVENNEQRRRVHSFDRVNADRVRLVLTKPGFEGASPRVCEIRVYDEPQGSVKR